MTDLRIPSKEQCIKILEKYNTPTNIIQHCLLVTEISENFCFKIKQINNKLVIAGAMLHDIGRSVDHSILHAIKGVKILAQENLDQRILSIVKRHIGTGINKEEAVKLGLPNEDYIPITREEVLVSYSDNLAYGSKRCSFEEVLEQFISKFGENSQVVEGFYKQRKIVEEMLMSD